MASESDLTDCITYQRVLENAEDIQLLEDKVEHLENVLLAIIKTIHETQQAVADTFDTPCAAIFSDSHFRKTNGAYSAKPDDIVYGSQESG